MSATGFQSSRPEVIVCIPTHNRAPFLKKCIDSILSQTLATFKLFVVDNASTDGTGELVTSIRDPRLVYVRNPANVGMVGNWNRCLDIASSEPSPYVALYHDDDWYAPTILEQEVRFLAEHPRAGLVQTTLSFYYEDENRIAPAAVYSQDRVLDIFEMIDACLLHGLFGTPSMMGRNEAFQKAGRFDPTLKVLADMDFWLRAIEDWDMGYIAEPLCYYRRHSRQESASMDFEVPLTEWRTVLAKTVRKLAVSRPRIDADSLLRSFDAIQAKSLLASIARASLLSGDHPTFERACAWAERLSADPTVRLRVAGLKLCARAPGGRTLLSGALAAKEGARSIFRNLMSGHS